MLKLIQYSNEISIIIPVKSLRFPSHYTIKISDSEADDQQQVDAKGQYKFLCLTQFLQQLCLLTDCQPTDCMFQTNCLLLKVTKLVNDS